MKRKQIVSPSFSLFFFFFFLYFFFLFYFLFFDLSFIHKSQTLHSLEELRSHHSSQCMEQQSDAEMRFPWAEGEGTDLSAWLWWRAEQISARSSLFPKMLYILTDKKRLQPARDLPLSSIPVVAPAKQCWCEIKGSVPLKDSSLQTFIKNKE